MSHDPKYMAKVITEKLIGHRIVGAVLTPDGDGFGLRLEAPDGATLIAWVDSDAEGNDSGWLSIDAGGKP